MPAPTWDPLDDDEETGDSHATAFQELEGRSLQLRECSVGAAPPDSAVEGQLWLDTSGATPALKEYQTHGVVQAWHTIGPLDRLPGSINADPDMEEGREAPHEYKALRVENVTDLFEVATTNKGLLVFRTSDGEYWFSRGSGAHGGLLSIVKETSLDTVEIPFSALHVGTTPPTAAAKGSAPAARGYLFDAGAESLSLAVVVPKNYTGTDPLYLDLLCALNATEDADEEIDWVAALVAVTPGASGGAVGGTATTISSLTSIGANVAAGALHWCRLEIDPEDEDNPVAPGSVLAFEIHRDDLADVAGVVLLAARLAYPQKPRHERA